MEGNTKTFQDELESLINRMSRENLSNTPDWILATFLRDCLLAFEQGIRDRDKWYGIAPCPGKPSADRAGEGG